MEFEKKYFARWWIWIVGMLILTSIIFGGLRYCGMIGDTIAERVIFENSFQYKEARKTEIATFQAQLAEIERRLTSENDPQIRNNLEAQAASLRIHLNVARSK